MAAALLLLAATLTTAQTNTNPNDTTTCPSPIRGLYASRPACAQSCLGCDASNETFEHNCDVNSSCCSDPIAEVMIPPVYACVRRACARAAPGDAQASWEEFLRNCAGRGRVVGEEGTPGGYASVSFEVPSVTKTGGASPVKTGLVESPNGSESGAAGTGVVSAPAGASQTASSDDKGGKEGWSTADMIGIVLGSVSAVATVLGVGWERRRRARRPSSSSNESAPEGRGPFR